MVDLNVEFWGVKGIRSFHSNETLNEKILPRGTFGEKFSTVGNWYFHLFDFKWGKITTWQEVQAISAEYERSIKMHGAF